MVFMYRRRYQDRIKAGVVDRSVQYQTEADADASALDWYPSSFVAAGHESTVARRRYDVTVGEQPSGRVVVDLEMYDEIWTSLTHVKR